MAIWESCVPSPVRNRYTFSFKPLSWFPKTSPDLDRIGPASMPPGILHYPALFDSHAVRCPLALPLATRWLEGDAALLSADRQGGSRRTDRVAALARALAQRLDRWPGLGMGPSASFCGGRRAITRMASRESSATERPSLRVAGLPGAGSGSERPVECAHLQPILSPVPEPQKERMPPARVKEVV